MLNIFDINPPRLIFPQYSFFNNFSGQIAYESWTLSLYNVVFTLLPPLVIGVFDQFVSARILDRYPQLYILGQKNRFFTKTAFWLWVANALYHSLVSAIKYIISSSPRTTLDLVWILCYLVLGRSPAGRWPGLGSLVLGNNALSCSPPYSSWESCSDIRVRCQVYKQNGFTERRQLFAAFGPSTPLLVSSDMISTNESYVETSYPRFICLHHDIPSHLCDGCSCHWIFY